MFNTKSISLIVSVFVMSFLVGYSVLSWTGPTLTAPLGNASAPLNVSATAQTKAGNLTLPILYDSDNNGYYVNPSGNSVLSGNITIPAIYGSSSASGNLTLDSTTNTTKGYVLLNSTGGNVGIGTTSPNAPLNVNKVVSDTTSTGLYVGGDFSGASQAIGIRSVPTITQTVASNLYGIDSRPNYSATSGSTQSAIYGVLGIPTISSSATVNITNTMGGYFRIDHSSSSSVLTNAYGVFVVNSGGTGTITNAYGLYIEPITRGTTNYAIYSGGGTNYFGGDVGIGTTSPNASSKLDVNGAIYQRGSSIHADVAEDYPVVGEVELCDVVSFAGDMSVKKASPGESVAGVISEFPGYRIRGEEGWMPVALVGRVQVKFIGSVLAGDYVFSKGNGIATNGEFSLENIKLVVGKALETKNCTDACKLLVMVGR